jgi:cell fate regulator YaaT (PSP1 superfamily)
LCGRLLCCLAYENQLYLDVKANLPKIGSQVNTPHGKGRMTGVNCLTETATVQLQNETTVEVDVADIERLSEPTPAQQPRKRKSRQRES